MNKRIKELAEQCTSWSDGSTWTRHEVFDKEKFAELIVLDLVKVIDAVRPTVNGVPAELALDWVTKNVKGHLGVEE